MERFRFQYDQFHESGAGVFGKRVAAEILDPVSVQQAIENFFTFLESTGLDAETIESAATDVLMDRFNDGIDVTEEPFELSDDDTDVLGIGA